MSYIIESQNSEVKKLYNKIDSNKEFEFMISNNDNFSLSYQDYLTCLEFLTKRAKFQKLKMESITSLDIAYLDKETSSSYRITIEGIETINKYMKMLHDWKNHVIYRVLVTKFLEGSKDLKIMEKVKEAENVVDITDYNIRIRLSEENEVPKKTLEKLKNISYQQASNITLRFKERISVYIEESKEKHIKIDLTKTNMTRNINRIENMVPNYELEIEYMNNSKPKSETELNSMLKETEILLKVIQQSNFVISKKKSQEVLKKYSDILSLDYTKIQSLHGRKPESLEIQYVTEMLPNKYAVTDKADGERNFLIIVDNCVYMINSGLHVKDTGIKLDKKLSKYNGSILDGENIFLPKENRHLMMIFDCLFIGEQDVRSNANFMERIKEADKIIKDCFVLDKQKGFEYKDYESKEAFNLNNIVNYHEKEIKVFMDNLNHDIQLEKKYPLVRRKYFIGASGAKPWEIFKYSELIWQKYTEDANIKCPYLLDGLIYHPLNQAYVTKESKYVEYKWKPPTKNSVDLYITFEKDPKTGKLLNVYDNSKEDNVRNKPYRIVNLFVGKTINPKLGEEPVPFREEEGGSQAYLFLQDGEVRDLDGKILSDKTVVEFYYNDNAEVDPKFRWIPIRTRYDKTEAVMKYRKNYGNYVTVANKVWRSITNPVLMSDLSDLAKGNNEQKNEYFYDRKIEFIRSKIGKELIITANKEQAYYTVTGNLAKPFRNFHNWIKSLLIYTNCNPMYQDDRSLSVLEIGVGRGGDIMKYYYTKVKYLVGIDPDREGITNSFNGAISRYNNFRKGKPAFPPMYFIQGNGGALLNYDDQFRALGGITPEDKRVYDRFFPQDKSKIVKFDRISCQFSIHYMFESKETLANFKKNINDYLAPGGYLICTCFDAEKVIDLLGDTDKFSAYYTNEKGEKKLLWQIIRKFEKKEKNQIYEEGNGIDFFGAWMFQEGQFMTEYLVDRRFIEKTFLDDCGLECVDTDMFDNQYKMQKEFITKYAQYESKDETKKFMYSIKEYYDNPDDEINKGCFVNDSITRYYVFRKKDDFKKKQEKENEVKVNKKISRSKKIQKGGNINEVEVEKKDFTLDLTNDKEYFIPKLEASDNSLLRSIHEVLQTHKIIPKGEKYRDLFKSLEIKVPRSKTIYDREALQELGKKIVIEHELEDGSKKKVINGVSIMTIEKSGDKFNINKDNTNKAAIVLLKEGELYRPIYKVDDKFNKKAIFKHDEEFIDNLFNL